MMDTRLGRRWNVDPIYKPWESPYATFSNNPVYFRDELGLTSGPPKKGDIYDCGDGTYEQFDGKKYVPAKINDPYGIFKFSNTTTQIVTKQQKEVQGRVKSNVPPSAYNYSPPKEQKPAQAIEKPKTASEKFWNFYDKYSNYSMFFDYGTCKIFYNMCDDANLAYTHVVYRGDYSHLNGDGAHEGDGQKGFGNTILLAYGPLMKAAQPAASAAKKGANLVEALNKVGGTKAVSEFLGWGNKTTILKTASGFTKEQLIKAGYTKQVLTEIHSGLMEAAKKTIPSTGQLNPASVARANQIQEILKTHFK